MLKEMFAIPSGLSNVMRYSMTHSIKRESVLEHTGMAVMLAYFIGLHLKSDVNMEMLLSRAVVHDIDEVATGDIPRPTKYYKQELTDLLKQLENESVKKITYSIDTSQSDIVCDWQHAKHGKEGFIVSIVDCLCVVAKIHEEVVVFNNNSFKSYYDHIKKTILEKKYQIDLYGCCFTLNGKHFIIGLLEDALNLIDEIK